MSTFIGEEEVPILDYQNTATISNIPKGVYTVDNGNISNAVAFAGAGGLLYLLELYGF